MYKDDSCQPQRCSYEDARIAFALPAGWNDARVSWIFFLLGAVLLPAACGSSSSSGHEDGSGGALPASPSTLNAYCTASCLRRCLCYGPPSCPVGGGPDPACVSECVNGTYQVAATRTREDWLRNQASCINAHLSGAGGCSSDIRDDCDRKYGLADAAFPNIAVVQKCHGLVSKRPTGEPNCGNAGDDCDHLAILTDTARQNADAACLSGDKTCSNLVSCIDQASGL
jgi:hypothetical protein